MKKQRNKNPIQPVIGTKVPRYAGPNETTGDTSHRHLTNLFVKAAYDRTSHFGD